MTYGMFTQEGNTLVERVVQAGAQLQAQGDSQQQVIDFVLARLEVLSHGEGFEEATDTAVRELAIQKVVDSFQNDAILIV